MRIGPPPPPCLSRYLFARSRRIWRLTARADRAAARSGPGNRHSCSHVKAAWRLAIRLVRDIVASSESGWTRHYARIRTRRQRAVLRGTRSSPLCPRRSAPRRAKGHELGPPPLGARDSRVVASAGVVEEALMAI